MERSVKSRLIEKFKAKHQLPIFRSCFRFFFLFKKKDFSENPVNLGLRILFQYTLNFNFSRFLLDDSAIMAPNLPQFFHEIIDSVGKIFTD